MESFLNTAAIWFIVGFIFFILEFAVPGFILFFFGIGAWAISIITLFLDVSINLQLCIFLTFSILSVLLFRKWIKNKLGMLKDSKYVLEDEIIGKTATAETEILPTVRGKVTFRGTSWNAASSEKIKPGEEVTIIGNESILLIVKPSKSL